MAFTAEDITACETAIRSLVSGNVTFVSIGGKTYRKQDLKQLTEYYDWLCTQVQNTADSGILRVSFKDKADM